MATCLITGGAGNLASQLSWTLSGSYERIVLFDVATKPVAEIAPSATFERGDLLDPRQLDALFVRHRPTAVIHLASLLSGSCEEDRPRGWAVNMDGTFALFEAVLRHGKPIVVFASSVAAFGGKMAELLTDDTPQWPDGLYGVTKMAAERLGVYHHRRHGVDFRCLRLPITVSRFAPRGAASAIASHAFVEAARKGEFTFRARPDIPLALIYVADVLRAFSSLMSAPSADLSQRVYNLEAIPATLADIAGALSRHLPGAELRFEPDPAISALLASWPARIDDSAARRDWRWRPAFDLESMAADFLDALRTEEPGAKP
jgi:threonine 3-dehydrogenase